MATISTNNQPSPERIQVETLLSIQDLCVKAHEHYSKQATGENNVDTYLLGAAEGYASVYRYIDETIDNIVAATGLDLSLVRDEMEKANSDLPNV